MNVIRWYGTLQVPTSRSCGGLVAFGRLEGPMGLLKVDGIILKESRKYFNFLTAVVAGRRGIQVNG